MGVVDALSFGKKMKLRSKVFVLLSTVLTGFVVLILIGSSLLKDVKIGGNNSARIENVRYSLEKALYLSADMQRVRTEESNLVAENDAGRMQRIQAVLKKLGNDIGSEFTAIVSQTEDQQFKTAVLDAQGKWSELASTANNEVLPAIQRGDRARARELVAGIQAARYDQITGQLESIVNTLKKENDVLAANTNKLLKKRISSAVMYSAAVVLLVLLFSWIILAALARPIVKGAVSARSAADGDLTGNLEVDTEDEVGDLADAFNGIVSSFKSLVDRNHTTVTELTRISRSISETAKRVIRASEAKAKRINETSTAIIEINASVKGVAQGVDSLSLSASENSSSILEMAASVEEVALNVETLAQTVEDVTSSIVQMTAAIKQIGNSVDSLIDSSTVTASSVVEMDSSIRQVEKNAINSAAISEEVRRDAEEGKASVEATIRGMQEIRRSSGITSEVIVTLSERANDIGAILSVIDEVAEQTNLLALNAAIIAAQAGDQGKGFAVVADEIKELADRTSSSTREIAQLIKGVQEETRRAVEAINQAEKSIADGELLSQKSGEALNKIVEGVKKSTEQVGEIAHAAAEQAQGSQMIRDAVEHVTDMIMQIANATTEQSKGSELIMTAVERMKGLTGQVRSSTREQSKVGGLIAQSTENITNMIQRIKRACDEQTKGSEQIVYAVEAIQKSTDENLEAVTFLDDAVAGLSRQIETIEKNISSFKVKS
jgi:methyl-accepting chemotaxis protein